MLRLSRVAAAIAVVSSAAPAFAQEPAPPPPAPAPTPEEKLQRAMFSLALERAGGISFAHVSAKDSNDSASLFTFGVAGATINPYAVTRLGLDYILEGGISIGGALGFTRFSGSSSGSGSSTDLGSVILYTLTPRVGYRLPLSPRVDLTPRLGLTIAGASVSGGGNSSETDSIFALAIGADAPVAFRLTDSFNLLLGAGFDLTLTASTSSSSSNNGSSSSSSNDVKGSLYSLQLWLGVGGYI